MPVEFKDYYKILGVPRGHGLPTGQAGQNGDLYVVINVQLPEQITEKERGLWKELSTVSHFNPRIN